MAITLNEPIPSTNIGMDDLYICFNKTLPFGSIDLDSVTDDYNDYWSPDKTPEYENFQGVSVYKLSFPSFGPNTSSPTGDDSVNISILGGNASIVYTLGVNVNLEAGAFISANARGRWLENGLSFLTASAFVASGGSDTASNSGSRTITTGSDTLTAKVEWDWDLPSADNACSFTFTITVPGSTNTRIIHPSTLNGGAFRSYET